MSESVETVPSQHIGAEACIRITNEFLTGGRYQIQQVMTDKGNPTVVSSLELKGELEPDQIFLVTSLETGSRYDISSTTDRDVVRYETFCASLLKPYVTIPRLLSRLVDDNEARLIHWYLPSEGRSELDIEGQLDPLLNSLAGRLRGIS